MNPDADVVLARLDPGTRSDLEGRAVTRRLDPGEILFLTGEPARRVYVLRSGLIKLVARDLEGRETVFGIATRGDLVGDLPALAATGHWADGIAVTRCAATGYDAAAFLAAVARDPGGGLELARSAAVRCHATLLAALEHGSGEVAARLAGRLLDLADRLGQPDGPAIEMHVPLAQKDLGSLAGMCRESACKTLRNFQQRGWLTYRRGRVRILRPDMLQRVRCAGRA